MDRHIQQFEREDYQRTHPTQWDEARLYAWRKNWKPRTYSDKPKKTVQVDEVEISKEEMEKIWERSGKICDQFL